MQQAARPSKTQCIISTCTVGRVQEACSPSSHALAHMGSSRSPELPQPPCHHSDGKGREVRLECPCALQGPGSPRPSLTCRRRSRCRSCTQHGRAIGVFCSREMAKNPHQCPISWQLLQVQQLICSAPPCYHTCCFWMGRLAGYHRMANSLPLTTPSGILFSELAHRVKVLTLLKLSCAAWQDEVLSGLPPQPQPLGACSDGAYTYANLGAAVRTWPERAGVHAGRWGGQSVGN